MIGLWIAAGVAAWITLAVPVAVVIGRSIRIADGARPTRLDSAWSTAAPGAASGWTTPASSSRR